MNGPAGTPPRSRPARAQTRCRRSAADPFGPHQRFVEHSVGETLRYGLAATNISDRSPSFAMSVQVCSSDARNRRVARANQTSRQRGQLPIHGDSHTFAEATLFVATPMPAASLRRPLIISQPSISAAIAQLSQFGPELSGTMRGLS
jgi:hypothetical protein